MFFPDRIRAIRPTDRVLEIGPGSTPHPRSDVFLEKIFQDPCEEIEQRGNTPQLCTEKEIVYYDGGSFPCKDKEFDYTICSHVIEHIEDVETFLSEIFRVSAKGYIEYPTIYYEYLYNFKVHVNFLKKWNGKLYYLPKSQTMLDQFMPVQRLLLDSLNKGYSDLVDDLREVMFEGFEWLNPFDVERAVWIEQVSFNDLDLSPRTHKRFPSKSLQFIKSLVQRSRC